MHSVADVCAMAMRYGSAYALYRVSSSYIFWQSCMWITQWNKCSASYVSCQRDTARICCCRAQFAAVRRAAAPGEWWDGETDRRTDRRTPDSFIDPAPRTYMSSVNKTSMCRLYSSKMPVLLHLVIYSRKVIIFTLCIQVAMTARTVRRYFLCVIYFCIFLCINCFTLCLFY